MGFYGFCTVWLIIRIILQACNKKLYSTLAMTPFRSDFRHFTLALPCLPYWQASSAPPQLAKICRENSPLPKLNTASKNRLIYPCNKCSAPACYAFYYKSVPIPPCDYLCMGAKAHFRKVVYLYLCPIWGMDYFYIVWE